MRIDLRHATMLKTSMCNLLTNKNVHTIPATRLNQRR